MDILESMINLRKVSLTYSVILTYFLDKALSSIFSSVEENCLISLLSCYICGLLF